jgi:hypothetical protein
MQRPQLEHIIRAAAGITGAQEFIIVGSQAALGQFPDAPAELLVSIETDVFSLRNPADADLIDGSIGEGSPFHQTFGYYAHAVAVETAVLPAGWQERLVPAQSQHRRRHQLCSAGEDGLWKVQLKNNLKSGTLCLNAEWN